MQLFNLKLSLVEKFVAGFLLAAVIMSLLPVSFAAAETDVVSDTELLIDGEIGGEQDTGTEGEPAIKDVEFNIDVKSDQEVIVGGLDIQSETEPLFESALLNQILEEETIKVHIYKYLKEGKSVTQVADDTDIPQFSMVSSWSASNIGSGSGSYVLGNNEGGTVLQYAADTSPMSVPADYATEEITDLNSVVSIVLPAEAECSEGRYRLVGYLIGDTLEEAESAEITPGGPSFAELEADKYVIVVNENCDDVVEEPEPVCVIGKNLLLNGSFEDTPTVTDHGGQWQIFAGGIMNWLATLSSGLEVWNTFNGVSDDVASDGLQNVELDGDDATNIEQTVGTIAGATYELKFDFSPRATIGAADNVLDALVNGTTILTVNGDGSANTTNVWAPQSKTFVAVGTSTKIAFEDKGTPTPDGGYGPLLDNVALCLVSEPEPLPTCTLTIKSDATDYVVEKNASAQLMSYIHPSWVTTLGTSTAAWIWGDNPVVDATVAETQTFKKGFNWTGGTPTYVTLKLSSDNTHAVTLGGFNATDMTEFNYGPADITTYSIPAANIATGANSLEIAVGNMPIPSSTAVDNPAGLMYELTITGTGKSCGEVVPEVPKTSGDVTMCKVDGDDEPLSGWTMTLLGATVDSIVVPAGNAAGVNTTASLAAGKSYVAVAQGTWTNDRTPSPINMVDAEYSTEDNWATQMDGFTGYPTDILELSINNVLDPQSKWGTYNGDHTYAQMFTQASTGTAKFHIADTFYGDNTGELNVTVFEGFAGITGENGCVTFQNVPFGTYDADEVLKAGWEQVEGAGDVTVSHLNTPKTITIVNEEEDDDNGDDATYILDGYKYACTEDNDVRLAERDTEEGYYNCDKDEVVAGWTIYATNDDTNEVLSTTTDADGYYYFEVEGGEWIVSEGDDVEGEWEQVASEINGVDYDEFTCTFTEMVDEEPSFFKKTTDFLGLTDSDEESYGNQCDFYNYFYEDYTPQTYTVTGFKWNDVDGDGVKDAVEGKLANWLITATQGTTSVATTTNASGDYTLILPYDEGVWVVSETVQGGWAQTGLYQNGVKVTLGGEVSNSCSFTLGDEAPTATCDFGNKVNTVVIPDPETPTPTPTNRGRNGGSGTRVTNRATPAGLVLGAATGTPACGMYLNDYMRVGNAASSTQVTKLQVFLNAVGITAPLTGIFDIETDGAVRAFQMKHKAEVLTPWYQAKLSLDENPTGWVYKLTRWKINNTVCPGSEAYPVLN